MNFTDDSVFLGGCEMHKDRRASLAQTRIGKIVDEISRQNTEYYQSWRADWLDSQASAPMFACQELDSRDHEDAKVVRSPDQDGLMT